MEELNSIEKYRKQQKQAKIKRRLILAVIVLALVLIVFSVDRVFRNMSSGSQLPTYDAAELSKGFPITMPTSATYSLGLMGNEVSLLTDTGLFVYNDGGNRILSFSHAYNSAVSETNETRTLIYDAGSYQFLSATGKNVIYNKTVTDKILFGKIAPNGSVAIITDSDRYASVLFIYDKSGKEIYSLSATEKIIACDFLPDSNGCVIATISAEGGEVYSKISCYKFSNKNGEEWSIRLNGSVAYEINAFSQNNVTVVADNGIFTIKKGEVSVNCEYSNKISDIAVSDSVSSVLIDDSSSRQKRIITVNKDGNVLYDIYLESGAFDIALNGSTLYTFDGRNIAKITTDGAVAGLVSLDSEYKRFTVNSSNIYLLSDTIIGRMALGEIKNNKPASVDTQTEIQPEIQPEETPNPETPENQETPQTPETPVEEE